MSDGEQTYSIGRESITMGALAALQWGTAMPTYRIYVLEKDNHIHRPPMIIECADDGVAIENAKGFLDGRAIEVWDHGRLVVRLDPEH
jgi:hypothetical protein